MPFSAEDKHAIELLRQTKQYGAKHAAHVDVPGAVVVRWFEETDL